MTLDWAKGEGRAGALAHIRILDFTTLLPGPLATRILARAGADVIKVEPPDGDPIRHIGADRELGTRLFEALNASKRCIALNLKAPDDLETARRLAAGADVLVEQFRPGVMARLGLGYEAVREINPGIVYCSLTGYGQTGPNAGKAGHDLTYQAEAGLLLGGADPTADALVPASLTADIAGGAYPAYMNIVTALVGRAGDGRGRHLDIAMTRNLAPFLFWQICQDGAPKGAITAFMQGSPRYALYRTADRRWLAVAALEDRFWERFCRIAGCEDLIGRDDADPRGTRAVLSGRIARRPADDWRATFKDHDVCAAIAATAAEAVAALGIEDLARDCPLPLDPGLGVG